MSEWKAKRFWKQASVTPDGDGYAVQLDGRSVKTPAKRPLIVPTLRLADAIAAEWDAQEGTINPLTMPHTRSANAAIDKVAVQFDEVAEMIAAYGDADLICYRADSPEELVARQAAGWDPLLDWSARVLGAPLAPRIGVTHQPQDAKSLQRLADLVRGQTVFGLTALHDLVAISGSLIIGLAVAQGRLRPDEAWAASRIDEDWQIEQWGHDDQAGAQAAAREAAFHHVAAFFSMSQ